MRVGNRQQATGNRQQFHPYCWQFFGLQVDHGEQKNLIHRLYIMVVEVFAVISEMTLGIIEPYNCGFIEIIPEGDGSDYWLIAGVHINGEAYRPTPRLYRSERSALTKAQKIYDWIANHENQIQGWGCWCSDLKITLWHQSKEYPSCPL